MTKLRVVRPDGGDDLGQGGGGPEDPMLEQRVVALEEKVGRIDSAIQRMEPKIFEIDGKLTGIDGRLQGVDYRIAGVEGRLHQIPGVWQIIAILATFTIGISGIIFAVGNYFKP